MATNKNHVININKSNILPPDIQQSIQEAKKQNQALMQLMSELLEEGKDYGTVSGVSKPFLYQPGAQQLGLVFKIRPEFEKIDSIIDFEQDPIFISYEYKCKLYQRETGMFLGEGVGSCNNYERKYKYYKDKSVYEDPLDRQNTLLKMAKKRAYVDAMLNVTGASRLFTQDPDGLDDIDETYTHKGETDPGEKKIPFGKHKGSKLKDIDDNYLKWVVKNADEDWLKEAAQAVINSRKQNSESDNDNGKKDEKKKDNNNNKSSSNRIKELNEIINGHNDLWDVVKDFLKHELDSDAISKVNDLSDKQWETLKTTLNNMIPEEPSDNDDFYEEDFDVPF